MVSTEKKSSPFVVFGPSKSGTTWVQKMLDAHPETSCAFQPGLLPAVHIERAPDTSLTRVSATAFGGVFADSREETLSQTRANFIRSLSFFRANAAASFAPEAPAEIQEDLKRTHRAMVKGAIVAYFDTMSAKPIPGYKMHTDVDFLLELFPDSRVIVVMRDGRDVCVSHRYHRLRQGIYYPGDERFGLLRFLGRSKSWRRVSKGLTMRVPGLTDILFRDLRTGPLFSDASLKKIASDWASKSAYILECRNRYPENHMLVRYEDMLTDPRRELQRMLDFLGADSSESVVDRIVEQTSLSKLKRNKDDDFFRKGVSGDWRNEFTPRDAELFKEFAGKWLIELGYEKDQSWTV